jgi:hypothetical protein
MSFHIRKASAGAPMSGSCGGGNEWQRRKNQAARQQITTRPTRIMARRSGKGNDTKGPGR